MLNANAISVKQFPSDATDWKAAMALVAINLVHVQLVSQKLFSSSSSVDQMDAGRRPLCLIHKTEQIQK